MSILIKGMKRPKQCSECPLLHEDYDALSGLLSIYCSLDAFQILDIEVEDINQLYDKIEEQKHCPLIELPRHGRLIDADKIVNYCMTGNLSSRDGEIKWPNQTFTILPVNSLSEIPTVLEADYD